jgi:hypothetical protein
MVDHKKNKKKNNNNKKKVIRVVQKLCKSCAKIITPSKYMWFSRGKMLNLQHQHNNHTTTPLT